jgi:ABC-2 type transport system ATP-binding protein
MKNSIEVKRICKKYDNFSLNNISIDIPNGSIVGLIGENGAGKTTLIKSILDIISVNSGDISILGKKYTDSNIKNDIGVVLDNSFFPELLNVNDIDIVMKNIYSNWDIELFNSYLKEFNIPIKQPIKTFSKGMRKKLEIATALSHRPKLLILDEPTSGLDPVVRAEILDIFLSFIQNENHTILLSTHITSDLEHIADYIIFIDDGSIVFNKTRDEILDNYGVLKVDEKGFNMVDKEDIIRYKKNRYSYDVLVSDRNKLSKKYKDMIIDKATLEDIMVLYIKGVK